MLQSTQLANMSNPTLMSGHVFISLIRPDFFFYFVFCDDCAHTHLLIKGFGKQPTFILIWFTETLIDMTCIYIHAYTQTHTHIHSPPKTHRHKTRPLGNIYIQHIHNHTHTLTHIQTHIYDARFYVSIQQTH